MTDLYTWFIEQDPVLQALLAGLFTWGLTASGAALVVFFNKTNRKILDTSLGFTGGVMIAASFWSLLSPAISYVEMQNEMGTSIYHLGFLQLLDFFGGFISFWIR